MQVFLDRNSGCETVTRLKKTLALVTDNSSTMTASEDEVRSVGIFSNDTGLEPFVDHFKYRIMRYTDQKRLIEKNEDGLEEFSKADPFIWLLNVWFQQGRRCYHLPGVGSSCSGSTTYRRLQWGDGSNHTMQKNQFGVWSIKISDNNGVAAIPHISKVNFQFKHCNGVQIDRIPAWIKYATVDPSKFAAACDGVFWDPSPNGKLETSLAIRYQYKYLRPPKPKAPRIYEAHVGMSSSEPRINSYREFTDDILPRIRANNHNTVQLMSVMEEHSYYACLGYHVTNFFVVSKAIVVAEDVSGMPGLCRPVPEGGVGFDYCLVMAVPDRWIDYLKNKKDDEWSMQGISWSLTNRRYSEKCVAYAESHDQAIVGDKTIAFLLMDKEMYSVMSCLTEASPAIE
ncbi:hypothetical protein MLD38_034349 [Melastoma candidum]|uniref:Uncharacterized protein n=1 Tax=Melastoma candidum TaxID=119954 RepID=A0ACB9MA82_9MYRT|nr:hypothetical protein MLD38_034349 [Melastoma candidum]